MTKEILTEELLNQLLSRPKIDEFLDKHEFSAPNFADCLNALAKKHKLEKSEIIKNTHLNETHAYQMFQGTRNASRDKVLQVAFAMKLSLKECNNLLNAAGVSSLYCKNRRDAIIIFCLEHNYSLQQTDETLYQFKEDTLSKA